MSLLRNRSRDAVFLCYHAIAEQGPDFLTVTPDLFERQLHELRRGGWRTGGLEDLRDLVTGRKPDRPTAFLTFDDGYLDNYTTAFPLLRAYGMTAIVYLLPPAVDTGGVLRWPEVEHEVARHPAVMRSMNWDQVAEMQEAGIGFGSHTLTHPSLPRLDEDALRVELEESRARVRERLGACDTIAYPFGHWDARVREAAAEAGYSAAFTLPPRAQRSATALSIPRLSVDHRDDGVRFRAKLSPAGRRVLLSPAKDLLRRLRPRGPRRGSEPAALGAGAPAPVRSPDPRGGRDGGGGHEEAPLHVMAVCSQGGHLQEMLALEPALRGARVTWATLEGSDVRFCLAGRDVVIAYGPTNRDIKNLLRNIPFAIKTLRAYRPDVIVSTGAGIAVPFFLAAKLTGTRTIYVESLARSHTLSLSGRLVHRLSDTFFVQWETLAGGKNEYHGSIL